VARTPVFPLHRALTFARHKPIIRSFGEQKIHFQCDGVRAAAFNIAGARAGMAAAFALTKETNDG
jgi:hypothetical protein